MFIFCFQASVSIVPENLNRLFSMIATTSRNKSREKRLLKGEGFAPEPSRSSSSNLMSERGFAPPHEKEVKGGDRVGAGGVDIYLNPRNSPNGQSVSRSRAVNIPRTRTEYLKKEKSTNDGGHEATRGRRGPLCRLPFDSHRRQGLPVQRVGLLGASSCT